MELVKGYQYELTGGLAPYTKRFGLLTFIDSDVYGGYSVFSFERDYRPALTQTHVEKATTYDVDPRKFVRLSNINLQYLKLVKPYEPYDPNQEPEDDCL